MGHGSQNGPKSIWESILLATFFEGRFFDTFWSSFVSFWLPLGSPLVPFWLPLAAFWFPLASFWLTFGALGITFAHLGAPFSHFRCLLVSFFIFVCLFNEILMLFLLSLKFRSLFSLFAFETLSAKHPKTIPGTRTFASLAKGADCFLWQAG